MKTLSFFIGIGLLGISTLIGQAQDNKKDHRYSFKSMVVEYNSLIKGDAIGGSTESRGSRTLWIDNYGQMEAESNTEKVATTTMGVATSSEIRTLSIKDVSSAYTIDLAEKTGTKVELRELNAMNSAITSSPTTSGGNNIPEQFTKEFIAKNGGKWLGSDSYKGRVCDKIELFGLTEWIYKGVVVKIEGTVAGMTTLVEATDIKEDVAIPASVFKVPAGVKIREVPIGITGADDGYENDAINAVSTITLSFARFKTAVEKISQLDYVLISSIEQGGEYMSVFMKSDSDVFMVQATSIVDLDLITGEDATVLQKLTINGHEAKIVQVNESEEGERKKTNSVFIRYPEFGMNIIVGGPEGVTETLLESVAQQLSF